MLETVVILRDFNILDYDVQDGILVVVMSFGVSLHLSLPKNNPHVCIFPRYKRQVAGLQHKAARDNLVGLPFILASSKVSLYIISNS